MFATAVVAVVLVALVAWAAWTLRSRYGRGAADGGYVAGVESDVVEKPAGLTRWLTTVDHEDIGLMYLAFASLAFLWGGTDAMMMRTELFTPSVSVWDTATYNGLFTMHGLTMLFLFATPAMFGFANYLVPHLVGADDMAFPRVNAIGFWLLPPALLLMRGPLLTDVLGHLIESVDLFPILTQTLFNVQPAAVGWTLYAPLSEVSRNPGLDLVLLGLHLSGVSTTMAGINFVATIVAERETSWADLDIFSWTVLTQSGIILFAFPLLGAAIVMLLLDRNFGTTFFVVNGGGPLLWQHLFWFFGHPEVYILVLPPMGLLSFLIPKFADRDLFGYKFVVYSTLAIGVLSFGVWAHHMFTTGMDPRLSASFMAVSLAIAVPSAVKTFNWTTTIWNGDVRLTAPMLFCVGGIATFIIGGVTGVFLAAIPVDRVVHGTYYVVGHFHLIIMGLIPFGLFAAFYYWFPLVTRRMYYRKLAVAHFVLSFVGVWVAFLPMLAMGIAGLPRRSASYPVAFASLQQAATIGAVLIALGQLFLLFNVVQTLRRRPVLSDLDVWNLDERGRLGPEWEAKRDD